MKMNTKRLAVSLMFSLILLPFGVHASNCKQGESYFKLAEKASLDDNYEGSKKWSQKAVDACSRFQNWYLLGFSEQKLGNKDQALNAYKNAHELANGNKENALVIGRFGEVLSIMGEREKALIHLQKALTLISTAPQWMTSLAKELDKSLSDKPLTNAQVKRGLSTKRQGLDLMFKDYKPSINIRINFLLNSTDVDPLSKENLEVLADALSNTSYQGQSFRLVGHTDIRGDDNYNLKLSTSRAEMVKEYLVGINPALESRLITEGQGEQSPVYKGDEEEDHRLNRRLQVMID